MKNKPKVFLSHSKKDEEFILRVRDDFHKCQIDSWVDTFEIRHGKSWLGEIFENGIPTCDSTLVYFTEDSLKSTVVKKEIDASLIQQLNDKQVAFLPYVSEEQHRLELRGDIQSLHVPVWNDDNYYEILPTVISEIWRSYLERTVAQATKDEKIKRLELELKAEQNKEAGVFTESENKDFAFIKKSLDYDKLTGCSITDKVTEKVTKIKLNLNLLSLLTRISRRGNHSYNNRMASSTLRIYLKNETVIDSSVLQYTYSDFTDIDICQELLMFGLVEREESTDEIKIGRSSIRNIRFVFTPKLERFKYWLAYNNCLPEGILYKIIEE